MIDAAEPLRAAQIGAGKIGAKRVAAARAGQMIAVADTDLARAETLAVTCGAQAFQDWRQAVEDEQVNLDSVATPNNILAVVARHALEHGKHVLVEKPCALDSAELAPLVELAKARGLIFQAGFNYRFHPAMQRAKALVESGAIGRLLHGTARHGHGGRQGLEKEWRARPEISGGGELLDQGVHLIDLARWFAVDEISFVEAVITTEFWPIQPLEDHAFCWIQASRGAWFSLEASLTQWKNLFYLELVGELGTLIIEGLGGSYGPERLTSILRPETFGAPAVETEQFSDPDDCWRAQWEEFILAVRLGREPNGSAADSLVALRAVEACRRSSQEHKRVAL
jgi:predicted dehydrogenase